MVQTQAHLHSTTILGEPGSPKRDVTLEWPPKCIIPVLSIMQPLLVMTGSMFFFERVEPICYGYTGWCMIEMSNKSCVFHCLRIQVKNYFLVIAFFQFSINIECFHCLCIKHSARPVSCCHIYLSVWCIE